MEVMFAFFEIRNFKTHFREIHRVDWFGRLEKKVFEYAGKNVCERGIDPMHGVTHTKP